MDINYNQPRRQKLAIKKLPHLPDEVTAEQRYWNTFKVTVCLRSFGS